MGRLAIMMVMGLTITLAVIGYQINQTNSRAIEHTVSFHKYTTARNIAHSGVNMALRTFDKEPPDTNFYNTVKSGQPAWIIKNFMSGQCSVKIWIPDVTKQDSVRINSKSRFIDTSYNMKITLKRAPQPFPVVNAAVALRVDNVTWAISGTSGTISGRDHDINGNVLPVGPNDKPGVAVWTATDTTKVLGDPPGTFEGSPRKVVQDGAIPDPSSYAQLYINAASYRYTGPTTIGGNFTWGSESAPVVIYANATAGGIRFTGNNEGWGILICKGDLTMSGTFTWHGLVIAYNDITITEDALVTGTPNIIGAFLVAGGSGSKFEMKGNCLAVYSSKALQNAMLIGTLQTYKVMKWYE